MTTYLKGRGLIDSHLYNNQLIERYEELQRLRQETVSARYDPQTDAALADLKEYGTAIKESYFEMKALVSDLTEKIDAYIRLTEDTSRRMFAAKDVKQVVRRKGE